SQSGTDVSTSEKGDIVTRELVDGMRELSTGARFPPQFIETRLRFSPFIKDIMTLGDASRPYIGALINIDMNVVSRWAEERKLAFSTFTDLSQKPEVAQLVREEIERVNRFLPEASRIRRFANFPKELDPDEGELTRTRQLRRGFLGDRHGGLIDALYAGDADAALQIPVTYQAGRKGMLSARVAIHDVSDAPVSGAERMLE